MGYKRFSSTKREEKTKDYLDNYDSSRPRLSSRLSSSSRMSTLSTKERNLEEERTSVTPILGGRQRGGQALAGRERSHYNPPGSGEENYGTILIKARSDGG